MNIQVGDLVWFHSLGAGNIKAKVILKYTDPLHGDQYRIRVTGRSSRIYPTGYVLDTTHNWISTR